MNKLELLDKLIDTEDEIESRLMAEVPKEVTEVMRQLYGEDGVAIANIYYSKMIEGKDNDDCPECAEKAKQLIEFMKLSQTITDSLTNNNGIDKCYEILKSDKDFINNIINMIRSRLSDLQYVDNNLAKLVLIKCLALT